MPKTLTESEVTLLRNTLLESPDALSILLLVIIETGCRGVEASTLRLADFDSGILTHPATNAVEHVCEVTIRRGAKGSASGHYSLTPETSKLVNTFLMALKSQSNPRLVDVHAGSKMQGLSALKALRRFLHARCVEAGITPISSLHVFRHRVAERMFRATNGNLILVQSILRHRSLSSTQHYLKSFDFEAARQELVKLNSGK